MTPIEVFKILEENDCCFEGMNDVSFDEVIQSKEDLMEREDFHYASGSSKGVIWFDNCDFVVKIPFTGVYNEDYPQVGEEAYPFEYAPDGAQGDNYCLAEKNKYQLLKDLDSPLIKVFAKIEYAGEHCGVDMYIQSFCNPLFRRTGEKYSEEKISETSKYVEEKFFDYIDPVWLLDVINEYGKDFVDDLADFIETEEINDLHRNNLGYCNNKPVIFDYSGFWD